MLKELLTNQICPLNDFWMFDFWMFAKFRNIALISLKVIALFHLKYKTELDPGHVPASELEIFVTETIVPKGSILDLGRSWMHLKSLLLYLSKTQWSKKNHQSQQNLFLTTKMFVNVNNKEVLLILNIHHRFISRRIRNHLKRERVSG